MPQSTRGTSPVAIGTIGTLALIQWTDIELCLIGYREEDDDGDVDGACDNDRLQGRPLQALMMMTAMIMLINVMTMLVRMRMMMMTIFCGHFAVLFI